MGTVLLRGLAFKLLNIRKTTSKRDSLYSDNVSNCFKTGAESLSICAFSFRSVFTPGHGSVYWMDG